MAKISTYPILSDPTINDILIGTDVEDSNITKNFSIGSIVDIVGDEFVPYVGATGNVNLGAFNITSTSFIVAGGLASQFLKANGTLDSTVYVPASRTLTINGVTFDLSANRSWDLNTIDLLTTTGTSGPATYIGKTLNIPQYQAQGNYITQLSGEATAVGPGNATVTLSNLAVISKILTGLNITGGTVTDTDSILTAFGKVQNQINGLAGGVTYQGTWNAATNVPFLQSSVGTKGFYYVVSVPGNTNLNGVTDWKLGDWAIFNGSAWEKVDNTDAVVSVNGYTGAVVLTFSDVGAPPATRTLTINGTEFDLTANRSWTVGDVRTDQTYSNPTWISSLAWGKITGTPTTLAGYGITDGVSSSRTLTINGVTFDLTANRSWNVGTVTSVGTSGPLTGGTITGSGTIGITQSGASSDGYLSSTDWNTFNNKQNALTNPVTGTGTINTLPMWGGATSLVNSPLSYGTDAFNFQYNSATGGTVNFTNIGLTAYTYSIQMNNFGSPRSTFHSYTDGIVVQSIGGTQVSRMFANGNFILGTGVVDNGYKLELSGTLALRASASASAATQVPVFIASPSGTTRELVTRTPAQLLGDAGAISGTIAATQVAFGTAANTIGGDTDFTYNSTTNLLTLAGGITLTGAQTIQTSTGLLSLQANGGNVGINTTTDAGFRLDVNGTARVQGTATITGSTTAASAIARGANLTSTLVAAANNDVLVGLDVNPTFTNGAFTGVSNFAARINGSLRNINASNTLAASFGGGTSTPSVVGIGTINSGALPFIQGYNNAISGTASLSINPSGNNVLIGTATDSSFKLDVLGSTRFNGLSTIQGTAASDSGQLGAELLTTGTGDASWTGTSFATGYTHVAGSTTTLTSSLAGVVGTFYQITYTVTGRTAGSFTIDFGGQTLASLTLSFAHGIRATTTGTLVITPTSSFDGTIVLSIRVITASSASVTFNSSSGTVTNQIRISNLIQNTFIGLNAGRTSTTGVNNTFVGSSAGLSNTTGNANSFFGRESGRDNTLGSSNSFFGSFAGLLNTTGSSNSFFGSSSGQGNTTGSTNSFFGQVSGSANTTGSSNSFFGVSSGQGNTTGGSNSFFGVSAGLANTTEGNNSFFGTSAGSNKIAGANNSFFGSNAGRFTGTGTTAMTSVSNSLYLGYQTRGLNATGSTNEIVIGYDVVGLGSNTTVLGNTSTTHGRWYGSLLLGTTTNAASSILTMESTTQGFLPPRMTTTQRNAIASPAAGLIVYDNTLNDPFYFNGTAWTMLQDSITLTTTGTSGAATLISNVLNIPQYTDQFVGTVTSVGLSMPSAFTVSNSPITSAGTLTVVGAGTAAQYVRGDGTLGDFPGGGGGGGSSVSYYLNGSVNQGTFVGNTYYEMNKVPIFGAGTDFNIATNGYIAQFITDANDPESLLIPAGNWNFETYFSASSGGGTPTFYIELYKYDGTTFTLIASNSTNPELISLGTTVNPYFSALGVPETVLAITDRLAIRIYVNNSGRTITLHTENSNLCQVITTFTTGLTTLNGLTKQVQYLTTGTSGTDFNISSSVATHVFNLPTASAVNRGALSSADWTTFNNKQNALTNPVTGTGDNNYISKFTSTGSTIGNSSLFDSGSGLGLGTASINASALFQMDSTTKGFLPPRMTAAQRGAISAPAQGLIVYQTDSVIGLYIYSNSVWRSLTMV